MLGYIYKTTNLINGKIYIGQHQSPKFQGTKYLGSGTILRRAITKYGKENFKVELLVECANQEELDYWERYYIQKENALDDNIGYNITSGGFGGSGPMTDETKKKISEYNKNKTFVNDGYICFKVSRDNLEEYLSLGYSFGPLPYSRSDEFKEKIRCAQTNKVAMCKGEHRTWVKKENVQEYLNNGYVLGWGGSKPYIWKSIKGLGKYKYMYKDGKYLKVAEDKQQEYLDNGWIFKGPVKNKKREGNKNYVATAETRKKLSESHKGHKLSKESIEKTRNAVLGRKNVHKKLCLKLVLENDIPKYVQDGWQLGRYSTKDEIKYANELWDSFIYILNSSKQPINNCLLKVVEIDNLYTIDFVRKIFNKFFKNEFSILQTNQVQNEFDHLQEKMPKEQAFEKLKEIHCELLEEDIIKMLEMK